MIWQSKVKQAVTREICTCGTSLFAVINPHEKCLQCQGEGHIGPLRCGDCGGVGYFLRCKQCNSVWALERPGGPLRQVCLTCHRLSTVDKGFGPRHDGSTLCKSGSIASGGRNDHCSCDTCF